MDRDMNTNISSYRFNEQIPLGTTETTNFGFSCDCTFLIAELLFIGCSYSFVDAILLKEVCTRTAVEAALAGGAFDSTRTRQAGT